MKPTSTVQTALLQRPISVANLITAITVVAMLLAASIGQWWWSLAYSAYKPPQASQKSNEGFTVVSDRQISDAIIQHIQTIAETDGYITQGANQLQVEIQHIPQAPKRFYHPANKPIAITATSTLDRQFRHQAYIRLSLTHPNGETHTLGVPVKITLNKPVWVAKQQIHPGDKLSTQNLVAEKRPITTELSRVVFADNPLTNQVARLVVLEGSTLKRQQVTVPLAVRSQGFVKIVMSASHGVRMLVEGKSLEDGHIGDLIRVRNRLNPDRLYTAKVIAPGRVAVTL